MKASAGRAGHGRIRCNASDVKVDTASIPQGYRPGPAELLCASLAACLLKNLERYSEMLPFDYQLAVIEFEVERKDNPPRMTRMRSRIEIATNEHQRWRYRGAGLDAEAVFESMNDPEAEFEPDGSRWRWWRCDASGWRVTVHNGDDHPASPSGQVLQTDPRLPEGVVYHAGTRFAGGPTSCQDPTLRNGSASRCSRPGHLSATRTNQRSENTRT